ncbi:solute carrier family 41 member 3-like isoform X2 [Tamandua tetradactyla]|uniref:solute carrier family 41 member 3-like isoform X2 n=1 Tax=Tamandua tetradactyla TaxID=48850 RepID=UPI004054619A
MMEAVETLQRRPEGPGSLGGRPAEAPSVPEGQAIAPKLRVKPGGETSLSIGLQVAAPFMCADLGLPMAGVLLDCLQANTGVMDPKEQHKIINSNLALVQVHAIIVGLLAALAALLLGAVSREELDLVEMGLLCASSVITAFLAAFTLGTLMVCIVIGARKLGVNPDNIVTPIAASLGDLITQSILALVSSFFYKHKDTWYLAPLVCAGFIALIPLGVVIGQQSPPVMRVLKFGWFPIILAMLISSFGGLILSRTISGQQ